MQLSEVINKTINLVKKKNKTTTEKETLLKLKERIFSTDEINAMTIAEAKQLIFEMERKSNLTLLDKEAIGSMNTKINESTLGVAT